MKDGDFFSKIKRLLLNVTKLHRHVFENPGYNESEKRNFFSPYLTEEFPVWWYTAPAIIKTFLGAYDFSEKIIVPFATSGGSGIGKTAETLREIVPSATVMEGKLLNGKQEAEELKKWADSFDK